MPSPESDVRGGEPRMIGSPLITRVALPACRAHYPGGSERVHVSGFPSPLRTAFPVAQAGRLPHRYFRGLLGLHSRYGPLARSATQGGLCHRAPAHPVARLSCLSTTRSNRLLSRWNLPPLATRPFGAHCAKSLRAVCARGKPPQRDFAHPTILRRSSANPPYDGSPARGARPSPA